jgi:hypothetical protein
MGGYGCAVVCSGVVTEETLVVLFGETLGKDRPSAGNSLGKILMPSRGPLYEAMLSVQLVFQLLGRNFSKERSPQLKARRLAYSMLLMNGTVGVLERGN